MDEPLPTSAYDLSREDRSSYARSAMDRGAERIEMARVAFRQLYPAAPKEMIEAAVFHVYVDGIDAAMMWLAESERFLRNPSKAIHSSVTYELLNHVYNWHMLDSLMPSGRPGLLGMLDEIHQFAAEGDTEAIQASIKSIKEMLDGNETAPFM